MLFFIIFTAFISLHYHSLCRSSQLKCIIDGEDSDHDSGEAKRKSNIVPCELGFTDPFSPDSTIDRFSSISNLFLFLPIHHHCSTPHITNILLSFKYCLVPLFRNVVNSVLTLSHMNLVFLNSVLPMSPF